MSYRAVLFDLFDTLVIFYRNRLPEVHVNGRVIRSTAGELHRAFRGIGRRVRRAAPYLRKLAKVAAPMVGTAMLGPLGGVLGRVASSALESELEAEMEDEMAGESEAELEMEAAGPIPHVLPSLLPSSIAAYARTWAAPPRRRPSRAGCP